MTQVQCPNCSSINVCKTTVGSVTRGAAALGGAVAEGALKAVANAYLFEGAGRLIPKFGGSLACLASVEYVCRECDCLFKTTFYENGKVKGIVLKKLPMPEEIITKVREEYLQTLRKKRPYISTAILVLLTLYCLIYMCMGIANESGLQFVLAFCFVIPFLIPAIIKWNKISSLNKEIKRNEKQTLQEFKYSHKELFRQYSQYN